MFESTDDLIAENHSRVTTIIDSRALTVVGTTEFFAEKVNAKMSMKQPYIMTEKFRTLKTQTIIFGQKEFWTRF